MACIKLTKNKKNQPIFFLKLTDKELSEFVLIKRAILESKRNKGKYNYIVPIRYFEAIIRIIPKELISIDKNSLNSYLEFSDDYDECYYYRAEANAAFMKNWRKEGCPDIYKVTINIQTKEITKQLAFKKVAKLKL